MKFFGTDDDVFFIEQGRKPGAGRVNELKSIFKMTADELSYQEDKIERNIAADYERLAVVKDPFLAVFLD